MWGILSTQQNCVNIILTDGGFMEDTRKNGFTLIELIVVIAIIGVLATLLVPAMLGYISKAKITSANSSARNIANGVLVALADLDAADYQLVSLIGDTTATGTEIAACKGTSSHDVPSSTTDKSALLKLLYSKVYDAFSDIDKIDQVSFRYNATSCDGVGILQGRYPGSYPIAIGANDFESYDGKWTSLVALGYALQDSSLYKDAGK